MSFSERAEMYAVLAEVLAEPPEWICRPGREWPLYELAACSREGPGAGRRSAVCRGGSTAFGLDHACQPAAKHRSRNFVVAPACAAGSGCKWPVQLSAPPAALRISKRVACVKCGKPMVSQAEMDFVISKIGHPGWLDYCEECRVPAQIRAGG